MEQLQLLQKVRGAFTPRLNYLNLAHPTGQSVKVRISVNGDVGSNQLPPHSSGL